MKRNGFTLIELMIVVGVLGILASIGVTYLHKQKVNRSATPPPTVVTTPATPVPATPPPPK